MDMNGRSLGRKQLRAAKPELSATGAGHWVVGSIRDTVEVGAISHSATAATALHRPFRSFSFLGKGCGDPLPVLPGGGPSPVSWRSERSVGNPARPRVVALRAGPRASASARRTSRAARRAAASGLRRWPIYDNAVSLG
jgi:hypothetical protein